MRNGKRRKSACPDACVIVVPVEAPADTRTPALPSAANAISAEASRVAPVPAWPAIAAAIDQRDEVLPTGAAGAGGGAAWTSTDAEAAAFDSAGCAGGGEGSGGG